MIKICKYYIKKISIIFKDGTTDTILPDNITFFSIEKNFFENFLPILNIKCMITDDLFIKLNTETPRYRVEINKFYLNNNSDEYDPTSKTIVYKNFINDIFININNQNITPSMMKNLSDRNKNGIINENEERNDYEKANKEIDLYLFKEDSISYRKLNNKILLNTDLFSSIIALSQMTNQNKILISKLDNTDVYNNIIIPQNLTFIGMIKYLQSNYGLYNTSYLLFNDFNILYLLNKEMECTAYSNTELKRVYINYEDSLKPEGNKYGFERQVPNKAYRIWCIDNPEILDAGIQTNEILYDDIVFINPDTGKEENVTVTNEKGYGIRNVKILENKYNNQYALNSMIYENNLNKQLINVNLNEIDLDIITPNKEYFLDLKIANNDYNKQRGLMKLSKYMAVFTKESNNVFKANIKCEFKKI